MSGKTEFQKKVYQLTKKIPEGRVSTYKEIAKAIVKKTQKNLPCRAVGLALKKNVDKKVPCHRVIKTKGYLGGFNQGKEKKEKLLRKEGVVIKKGRINLKKYLFSFS